MKLILSLFLINSLLGGDGSKYNYLESGSDWTQSHE